MDAELADKIASEVDKNLSEIFKEDAALDHPVVSVPEQTNELGNDDNKEGDCHIFNYQSFDTQAPREGSEKDAERLRDDFTQLNFDVHLHENLTYEETEKVLREAAKKDYSKCKYFICCFLSHGGQNYLWAKDQRMKIDDILTKFSESDSLKGIPKIFIIQACRGEVYEQSVSTDSTDSEFSTDTQDFLDFLIVYSTYLDTYSFRAWNEIKETCYGSYFVNEFCRSLEQFSSKLDLLHILTIVNYRMANFFLKVKDKNIVKQMPCFTSTLRKRLEFNRKIKKFVSSGTQHFDVERDQYRSCPDDEIFLSNSNNYKIEAKRGLCLSIVDEKSVKIEDLNVRIAVDSLRENFANRDFCVIHFRRDFKRSQILKFLKQNCNQLGESNKSTSDCLVCYIAAYSRYDKICDASGRKISKKEIIDNFIEIQNKSFVGKPKVFIFLLRQLEFGENIPGEKFCKEAEPHVTITRNTDSSSKSFDIDTDGRTEEDITFLSGGSNTKIESTDGGKLIPVHADILEISITVNDWKQVIGPMKSFSDILDENSTDLTSLLTEFNRILVEEHNFFKMPDKISKSDTISKCSFSMTSTLTRQLNLPCDSDSD